MKARSDLAIAPAPVYALKAALTRARSLRWLAGGGGVTNGGVRILFYHRISDDSDELAVSPRRFREQMDWLSANGFQGVDVPAAMDSPPAGSVGLSFDDAFADIADHALPELERHGFYATVFAATAVVAGTARFSWYERQPRVLSWDELVALDGGAFRFEAHTVTHPRLPDLDESAARAEIAGSKTELEARLGRPVELFCYPAGLFGERERRIAAEAGFRAACSCEPGLNDPETDRFALRRIQIDHRDRLLDFRAKVSGGHDSPSPVRSLWRRLRYRVPSKRS